MSHEQWMEDVQTDLPEDEKNGVLEEMIQMSFLEALYDERRDEAANLIKEARLMGFENLADSLQVQL